MSNRFYTVLVVPEKTSTVRRVVVPAWMFRTGAFLFAGLVILFIIMGVDYAYVINQVTENRELKFENRRLRQQVQVFENKIGTIESTLERVRTFTTRLKVITNISDRGNLLQSLNEQLPDAQTNVGIAKKADAPKSHELTLSDVVRGEAASTISPEDFELKRDFDRMDDRLGEINRDSLSVEQILQDQYELLADQRSFLAALPTRRPTIGYFTSGFGVRKAPIGDRIKMHEGLDIANRPGTLIRATADGTVEFADSKAGYGRTVILDHGYGIETYYGHTMKMLVKKGEKVQRGDEIALLGSTGRSTGPHLHYEVRVRGTPVDPLYFILEN